MSEVVLEVSHLTRRYGAIRAVDDISFEIRQGETLALLGPSGCGKSTTLRMIAGLDEPDGGEIRLRGRLVASAVQGFSLSPDRRNVGLVFQSYAIWPHMTVFENVAYPLRARGIRGQEVRRRVLETLELVGLSEYVERRATQLSGGQQQRVALARAFVYQPDLLLLDEPLSNLDTRRRHAMRVYLKDLQRRLGMTVLFVTHDQIEAMTLSHRIAVMRDGRIEDVGTPQEIYGGTHSRFVYEFVGRSIRIPGLVQVDRGQAYLTLDHARLPITVSGHANAVGDDLHVTVRPEAITIDPDVGAATGAPLATITDISYLGTHVECTLRLADEIVVLDAACSLGLHPGQTVALRVAADSLRGWPTATVDAG